MFKNISASEEEKKTLKEMQESGVKVYFQVTPNDRQTMYEEGKHADSVNSSIDMGIYEW